MISFEHVSKRYDDGTQAVTDFSLTIASHSLTALVGSSGSGKTTLLRCINRMVEPTSGRILWDGVDIAEANPVHLRRQMGYVMQQSGLLPHRKVIDNVATVLRLTGVDRTAAYRRAREVLNTVGLEPALEQRYPAQLSGGQAQRVGVARALAADPKVLLMDEPFGAVDPIVRRELQREIARLHAELHKTIIFVTHDIDEAFALADQIVILKTGGVIAQVGSPAEILANPADDFVRQFLGLHHGERQLRTEQHGDHTVVLTASGRVAGVLT
ncbi:MAG: ATP-binding cassette domain-containing protein [Bowdeniella nasicola]|nr:ATP-binding cassette domain-containing protein [Bowdeniella nasicola]